MVFEAPRFIGVFSLTIALAYGWLYIYFYKVSNLFLIFSGETLGSKLGLDFVTIPYALGMAFRIFTRRVKGGIWYLISR